MFIVIDEAVELALLQLADYRSQLDGAPMLELDALVRDGEGVTTVGLPGQLPSYLAHSPGEPLPSFGVNLPSDIQIKVWDSTAEVRYLVIPKRPIGTERYTEEDLASLVTRNSMIGTGIVTNPEIKKV